SSGSTAVSSKICTQMDPQLEMMRWGLLPAWAKDPKIGYKTINARAETVNQLATYKPSFRCMRCLIPADGFYERALEDGKKSAVSISCKERTTLFNRRTIQRLEVFT
ncbi:MAG: SOS response-associated peptidase family protein, partial [Roseiflexaceae bacterium]